tara:strand:+ start:732 stop:1340 length:609 start_codon:yes stop_codon:yes gene_type:complete
MAFSNLEKALAAAVGLDIAMPGTSRKAATAAARALAGAAARGAPIAARGAASFAAANPITAGIGLGLGALQTSPGQALLESAAARGASDRVRLQQAIDSYIFEQAVLPYREQQGTQSTIQVSGRGNRRDQSLIRRPTQHQQAVQAGMKALKASKYDGPKGTLRRPKLSFSKVNKTISKIKKRKKVARTGATGVIARAVKKYT